MGGTLGRPIKVRGMAYAPTNESGVVALFGRLAPQIGFQIEEMNTRFPDCIAVYRGKRRRVEIEYRASNFQGHNPRGADVIVCWENDWEARSVKFQRLEIVELKRFSGALPRVIAVGCDENARGDVLDARKRPHWSVPSYAAIGDLVVMYRSSPASEIRDLWRIVGPFFVQKEFGLQAYMKRLVRLEKPITWQQLKGDPSTRSLGMVKQSFRGKRNITDEWPLLYRMIIERNKRAKIALREYAPD